MIIDIHPEGLDDRFFPSHDRTHYLRDIIERKIPVVVSVPPMMASKGGAWDQKYGEKVADGVRDHIKAIVHDPKSALAQQGLTHQCHHKHRFVDPYHENACLWKSSPSVEDQREFMQRGRELLERLFGISPHGYVPPNHLHTRETFEAAEHLSYTFLMDQAHVPLKPYRVGPKLIVIPEMSVKHRLPGVVASYIHYDEIGANAQTYAQWREGASSIWNVTIERAGEQFIYENQRIKHFRKYLRDMKGIPDRVRGMFSRKQSDRSLEEKAVQTPA